MEDPLFMLPNHFDPLAQHDDGDANHHDKGKQREQDLSGDLADSSSSSEHNVQTAYPPASEDIEETRRIEENLRKWEIAERQRRKAARVSSTSNPTSLVANVSRRASLLWTGRKSKHVSISGSHRTALSLQDSIDIVPLQPGATSPTPSLAHTEISDSGQAARLDDPFANPADLLSPFSDSFHVGSTAIPVAQLQDDESSRNPSMRHPPRPKFLNLPQPKTPPPMDPTSSHSPDIHEIRPEGAEPRNVRWWHDWLCGCGEGPDRGGDYQAGRTNPFE